MQKPTDRQGPRPPKSPTSGSKAANSQRPMPGAESPPRKKPSGYALLKKAQPGNVATKSIAPTPAKSKIGQMSGNPASSSRRGARPDASTASPSSPPTQVQNLMVEEQYAGQRIDNFLVRELKGAPKSLIYRILRSGEVRVDSKRAKPDLRLQGGEKIRIPPLRLSEGASNNLDDVDLTWLESHILFEDKTLLVLDKPSGLASHGGSGLSFGAIEAMRSLRPQADLELVHRLDRDTSGILLIAKKRSQLKTLQNAMINGEVTKRYIALVKGQTPKQFKADFALQKNELSSGERIVKVDPNGKACLTFFKTLEQFPHAALVQAELGTGRTHQIRVHSQTLGHELAGDDKYGDAEFNKQMRNQGLKRLFLHATSIAWQQDGELRSFVCKLPRDLQSVVDRLTTDSSDAE